MAETVGIEVNEQELIPLEEVPARLGGTVSMRSVRDLRWRRAAGLRVVRVGRRIVGVRPDDLAAVVRRGF